MSSTTNPIAAVWQILKEEPTVYALTKQRVYPRQLPQKTTYPAVVYSQLSENYIGTKDGPIPDGHRFQLEFYAERYSEIQTLARTVKNKLDYYSGTLPKVGKVIIHFNDQSDAPWEDDIELYKIVQDYNLQTC